MHIKIDGKKFEIKEYTTFKDRFKSLKFVFEPLTYGIKIPNKRIANTYLFVQRVDICFTDSDNRIIKMVNNVKTEKLIFNFSAKNVYYFPLNTNKEFRIGDIIK